MVINFFPRGRYVQCCCLFTYGVAIASTPCEKLTDLEIAYTTITSASLVDEGPAPKVGMFGGKGPQADIPAHCRLQLDLQPSSELLPVPALIGIFTCGQLDL